MRKLLLLSALLILVTGANATLVYTIAPGTGYSEPLSQGDVLTVGICSEPDAGYTFQDAWFVLFYNSTELGTVYTTYESFGFDSYGYLVGSDPLNIGTYTMADAVGLRVTSRLATSIFTRNSTNTLAVGPTGPMTPSTSAWGLIILLLSVPAIIIWRR